MTDHIEPVPVSCGETSRSWTAEIPADGAWRFDVAYRDAPELARRKPLALAENGPVPDMDELVRSRTPWLWFMNWSGMIMDEQQTSLVHLKRSYSHPYTVTSAKLPGALFEA